MSGSRPPASAFALAASMVLASAVSAAGAADTAAAAGRQKAGPFAVCHGPLGLSVTPDAPNLAGQPALYLSAQLKAYRSGARRHEVMSVMAKALSDDDIEKLAVWYASQKISVQAAP